MDESLNRLKELLVGKTVEDILPGVGGESLFIAVVKDGKLTKHIPVFANDMGWWLGPITARVAGLGDNETLYIDPKDMLQDMVDDLPQLSRSEDELGSCPWEPVDNPMTLRLGFRCTVTDKVRWIHLGNLKISPYAKRFSTEAARRELVQDIWDRGYLAD